MDFESSGEKNVFGANLVLGVNLFSRVPEKREFNPHGATLSGGIPNDTLFLERGNTYSYSTWSYAKEYPNGKTVEMSELVYIHHDCYQFFFLGGAFMGGTAPLKFEFGYKNGNRIGLEGLIAINLGAVLPYTVIFNLALRANLNKGFPGTENPHLPNHHFCRRNGPLKFKFTCSY
jgi:hypothetical protein